MIRTAILLTLLQLSIGANLPDSFKRCHMKSPDFSRCLKAAVQDSIQKIGNTGISSLGVGPIQPMNVKEIMIDKVGSGPVSLKLHFSNLKIYGIPESTINSFQLDNYEMKTTSTTPLFKFDADYVIDGQLLVLPVKGKGKCTISLDSLITIHDIKGIPVTRDGETYLSLKSYSIKLSTKKLHSNFQNLFNGDKVLGETLNTVMNENSDLIFNELRPALEKAFGNVFLEYSKTIFDKVPFNEIFLP